MKKPPVPSNPESWQGIREFDLTHPDQIRLHEAGHLLHELEFIPGPELKDIHIPILTPPVAEDVPGSEPEPVYDAAARGDIQGNIIPGFNKDHQQFLFFRITQTTSAKKFLKWLLPYISSMEEVMAFRRIFRATRFRLGKKEKLLAATWVNTGFTRPGLDKLAGKEETAQFGDQSFCQGMAERSTYLGDPGSVKAKGNASRWLVGGPDNEPDMLVIIAADSPDMLLEMVERIKSRAAVYHLELLFEQRGDTLPGDLRGHEHFGFRDGVSQPGIRGKLSSAPGDYITPRYISGTDNRRLYYARPGQLLAWPGQFLLGEQRQSTEHIYHAAPPAANFPAWAARGSYMVVRRLEQDVRAFWRFVSIVAGHTGADAVKFASMLVGRWPGGAPLMRSPAADLPALGEDGFANNHFLYDDDTRPSELRTIPGYPGDHFPQAAADMLARVCPHFAHIRKMNPRDEVTDLGKPADNLVRMILRRGIPFGPPLVGVKKPSKKLLGQKRGLMFVCYGSSIEEQFEFLQRRWANNTAQPNTGGHDPIIGQNGNAPGRVRFIDFPAGPGIARIRFREEWVTPTGGGYFFAPAISAIRDVLSA